MKNGIDGVVFRSYEYGGYALRLLKREDMKLYRIDPDSIKWIETQPYSYIQPLRLDAFEDSRSEGEKGNLYGENLALKNEIAFLREQIANLLGKV